MKSARPIEIDGSIGEGGGQILRSALALSMVTGKPCLLANIRAGRSKPGILRQHLTALRAAAEVGSGAVEGAALGSSEILFTPGPVRAGDYGFSVGTAGSTTLVLQTVLPPLLVADGVSEIVLEGGTHNPFAPPFDFFERVLLPVLERMGPRIRAKLERPGFYPAGGGLFRVTVEPAGRLSPIDLLERGEITRRRAVARVSNLPTGVAGRELSRVAESLSWRERWLEVEQVRDAAGPGNVLIVEIESENVVEQFSGFGRRGVPAERVAGEVVEEAREYLDSGAPVGRYLADQLLVPLAMAGRGSFRGSRSRHRRRPVMKSRDLKKLGIPAGETLQRAMRIVGKARKAGVTAATIKRRIATLVADPELFRDDEAFGALAAELIALREVRRVYAPRAEPAPWRQWGENLEPQSVQQLHNACSLPVAVRGALMPDAHVGYGLPIGGVLATRNAVIPYAVGVDIACRMKMSVLDLPVDTLKRDPARLIEAIHKETRFGIGSSFKDRRDHDVMDEDWSFSQLVANLKDKAWKQLGTSGSGNHFVEFGILELDGDELGLEAGLYLALLSHSGSRGAGATIAGHYSRLARKLHPELPRQLTHLAWLDLDTEEGQEYWRSMELMGKYAAANHACIHREIPHYLGARVILDLENHHNFAWREVHDGEELIVHRKGSTPAGEGVLGIIPGSMATTTYIARGKGNPASLNSAAHGAGRVMSRKQAKRTFQWSQVEKLLDERGITLLSAGLDEAPMVYKDIHQVMAAQADLVEPVAKFEPRIVKMAPAGERPED
jgi:tRNA-splicing ligase RtcB